MDGRIRLIGRGGAALVLAFGFGALLGVAQADYGDAGEAARSTAGQLEGREATTGDPDEMTAESRDPEETLVESGDPEDHEAESANPASMVTDAGDMEGREATSRDLDDLAESKPDQGFEAIEVPGQSEWEPTTDPDVLLARQNLVRAQKRARAARTAYGNMQERNYPRGEARIRIVNERDASMEALEEAKRALAKAQ